MYPQAFTIVLIMLLNFPEILSAQNVVVFQGFEGTIADTWGFTPPVQASGPGQVIVGAGNYGAGYAKTGTFCMRAGGGSTACGTGSGNCLNGAGTGGSCNNLPNGKMVQFNAVNVECLSGVQISVSHRSHAFCSGQGQGFDAGENLVFEVSLNGGGWTSIGTLGGFSNYTWQYTTSPSGSTSMVPNPFVYNVPAGTITVAFRTNCNVNRSDEVYYIDDVKLTTTTTVYNFPGTAGLWNGTVNTDWTNKCNWDDRLVPTIATDVFIPNAAVNSCEVLPTLTGNCHHLRIDKSKLAAEYFTSTLNVTGDLIIDNYGELDMSLSGIEGGTLNLSGFWLNKRNESYFDEGKSTVNFIGTTNQTITALNDTKEAYYKMGVTKSTGSVITNTDIWIDQSVLGGTSNLLTFSNGLFDLNSHSLTVWNPNFQAVLQSGGGIVSEKTDNSSRIIWKINSYMGNYIYPFIRFDGTYIPFTFNHTTGNAGDVTLATYGTLPDNLPWPTTPDLVTNLTSASGLAPDNRDATVDRFWQIDVSGSATANLTFTYAASELPVAPFNNPTSLLGQGYTTAFNQWLPYLTGQTAGSYFVTVPNVSTFSPWTLTNTSSPLPVELLNFNAFPQGKYVEVTWATASETANDYFTVLRSKNGLEFDEIGRVDGSGNSTSLLNYHFTDLQPYDGLSFYRLQQTDFNGRISFAKIVSVHVKSSFSFFNVLYTNHTILLNSTDHSIIYYELMDALGNVIYSIRSPVIKDNQPFSINTTGLSKGIYFLKAASDFHAEVKKLFIY